MTDASPSRRIVLLVPDRHGAAVLACNSDLPMVDCTLVPDESTIEAAARILLTLGLHGPILDCVIDQSAEADLGDAPRSALVEVGPPPSDWTLPPDWAWLPWTELRTAPAAGIEVATATRIAELRGESVVPDKRAAWTRPGWHEQAIEWIAASLEAAGRSAPDSIVQVRHCGISAVLRADGPDGRTWFKACFPPFHSEAPITAFLATIAPGATCAVLAADASRGWLLLEDFRGSTGATDKETTKKAVDHLVRLQSSMSEHQDVLRANGFLHRPLARLAIELEASLATEVATSQLGLSEQRTREVLEAVATAAASIEAAGFPETLVHGDFHPGNVAATNDGIVLFDWSDAAIGCPIVEVATWASWFDGDEHRETELWSLFCSAWAREFGIEATSVRRCDADVVAGAFHTTSYVRLLMGLEPSERAAYAEALDDFFEVLTDGVAATASWDLNKVRRAK